MRAPGPAIIQSDRSVLLEVAHPSFDAARAQLQAFAELEKRPEHVHTYRITPVSLWNAAASGLDADAIVQQLVAMSRYDVPQAVLTDVHDLCARYGRLRLVDGDAPGELLIVADDAAILAEVCRAPQISELLQPAASGPLERRLPAHRRGELKQALIALGWPVEDRATYESGDALTLALDPGLEIRDYQREAVGSFVEAGAGVVVLPCGAGKTIVGIAAMAELGMETLVVTTNSASLTQWRDEILRHTSLAPEMVGEYSGQRKQIRPVTITSYQMLTHSTRRGDGFPHLELFQQREWGLVIYDEVHLLPAPVFRATASIQARRRMGLTATLVREDGAEPLVFTLVGPKRSDGAWRSLERAGWIAQAQCSEVRVPMGECERMEYALAEDARQQFRMASTSERKDAVVEHLLERHCGAQALVIGHYLDQLRRIARRLDAPVICGSTPRQERERLYDAFRAGEVPRLCVSRVANFALDLPSASVAVQVSGTFGSRQEEAQRLGRLLRPKAGDNRAWFYTVVSHETCEQDYAHKRQRFLAEQGYAYAVEVLAPDAPTMELAR